MMLEAASLDLGSVWISYFDQDKARELLRLPENWKPVCMLYIGYPADDSKAAHLHNESKNMSEIVKFL